MKRSGQSLLLVLLLVVLFLFLLNFRTSPSLTFRVPSVNIPWTFPNSTFKGNILHFAVLAYSDTDFTMARTWIHFMRLQRHNFVIVTDHSATLEFCKTEQIYCFNGSYFAVLYPRCTPANKGDHMGVMKVGFALEALRRGYDVVCSDIDTVWLKPFPNSFWRSANFSFWFSVYSYEFESCSGASLSNNYTYFYEGKSHYPVVNFGGWVFRSTPRAITVVQDHFNKMTSFDDPDPNAVKCNDQDSWNTYVMRYLQQNDYEIMAPCLFTHYIRFSKYFAKFRDQMPNVINLHMTEFFNPAQKVPPFTLIKLCFFIKIYSVNLFQLFYLQEMGIHAHIPNSPYYIGKFLFVSTQQESVIKCYSLKIIVHFCFYFSVLCLLLLFILYLMIP